MDLTYEIYEITKELLGEETDDGGAVLKALCAASGSELISRLKDGVRPESIRELFITAAGILALSMYIELGGDFLGAYESIKVGNISVVRSESGGEGKVSAERLRRQAEQLLSSYLRDSGFDFRGVRG